MSPNNQVYILDTNVFIEAAKRYYALDFAPGFWNALVAQATNGRVMSIDKVKNELHSSSDIRLWANSNFHTWFDSTS